MAKNYKLIKGVETTPLKKLNEGLALKNPDKYVFQGVFTACSTPDHKIINRNGRSYPEKEMLRHLGYLRDMIKENNGKILGELDHPEGRFDVQMKEASHMITDLWYDDKTKCVMGRLEVLDTPNGKTLKSLIDAGFPLYVSSRAAGDVNERTKEVEIAQIFTYDVVCTPGFKEARLERVNESMLTDKALKYINESISDAKIVGKKDISVPVNKINESMINEFNNTKKSDVCKPLLEEDDKKEEPLNDATPQNFFPIQGQSAKKEEKKSDKKEDKKDLKEEDEAEDSSKESEEASSEEASSEEASSEEASSEEDSAKEGELSDEEKEENRKLIIDVIGLDKDGEPVKDEESEEGDEDKSDDIVDISADEESSSEEASSEESSSEEASSEESSEENEKAPAKDKSKSGKLKQQTDADIAELESVLKSVEKSEGVKESIIRRYPFAISLSESNFAKFASLRPKLKKRCADFIDEHQIYDIEAINELWTTPLREEKKLQQNWLKLADQSDIDLYVAAPLDVQNAIEESAKYVVLETKEDVDMFWHRTGLRQEAARKLMNEKLVSDYRNKIQENREFQQNNPLGYSENWIKMTEEWFKNNE